MRLNLGCGFNPLPGYVNADKLAACDPDLVVDLEQPWPWPDNSADEIVMNHVLEHLGRTPEQFLDVIREGYRVLKPGGAWRIVVPHPRHDDYLSDPTHVRPIMLTTLEMFDRQKNEEWIQAGFSTTPLAIVADVDFVLAETELVPDDVWVARLQTGEVDTDILGQLNWHQNNIAREIRAVWVARKA